MMDKYKQKLDLCKCSVTEINEKNITFILFNSSSILNVTAYTTAQRTINWTNISDGTYRYNVSISIMRETLTQL